MAVSYSDTLCGTVFTHIYMYMYEINMQMCVNVCTCTHICKCIWLSRGCQAVVSDLDKLCGTVCSYTLKRHICVYICVYVCVYIHVCRHVY